MHNRPKLNDYVGIYHHKDAAFRCIKHQNYIEPILQTETDKKLPSSVYTFPLNAFFTLMFSVVSAVLAYNIKSVIHYLDKKQLFHYSENALHII